jgi:nucleotide-binding universal stress UspA family protein
MSDGTLRILVPVDFSPYSDAARRYAARLAARLDATLELLHVVEAAGSERDRAVADAERRLEAWRTRTAQPGLRISTAVRVGLPAQMVPDYAENARVDLLVMGRHGCGVVGHDSMGRVAARVLREAPCPVLTLQDDASTAADRPWAPAEAMTLRAALGRGGTSRE